MTLLGKHTGYWKTSFSFEGVLADMPSARKAYWPICLQQGRRIGRYAFSKEGVLADMPICLQQGRHIGPICLNVCRENPEPLHKVVG